MHDFRVQKEVDKQSCAFCRKNISEVDRLIAGPFVSLCGSCIAFLHDMLLKSQQESFEFSDQIPTPREVKKFLDLFVVGQDRAKIALAVAVYSHYTRIKNSHVFQKQDVEIEKANVVLIGSSGTGKTLLARTLAKKLQVPFTIADATTLTEAGYVGEDVEGILLKLYRAAGENMAKAERGVIYIDEIDKIARRGENVSITRDVSGEGVQQALLKIIEGTEASFSPTGGRKHPNQELLHINTTNILFICGGAFVGLEGIIKQRLTRNNLGFVAGNNTDMNSNDILSHVQTEDLINFGIIPEFVGRLPVKITLDEISKEDIMTIATEPRNAIIRQYRALLATESIDLVVEDDAIEALADKALQQKTGARGLRTIIEQNMTDVLFETITDHNLPLRITITKECILNNKKPHVVRLKHRA